MEKEIREKYIDATSFWSFVEEVRDNQFQCNDYFVKAKKGETKMQFDSLKFANKSINKV